MALEIAAQKKLGEFIIDVSFSCENNRMGILGASGCGKSMTLKMIAGIEKPDRGRIVLDGRVLFDSETKTNLTPQQRQVGYLFQNYALFPTMTVSQNIACVLHGSKQENALEVKKQLAKYQLEGLENHYPRQLSGGQQQRVALARMLSTQPQMIMLDEPFSALDGFLKDVLQRQMQEMLADFPGEVLIVSHSRDEIYKFCDRLTIISDGRSILTGDTKEIFMRPRIREAARLTGCKNISRAEKRGKRLLYALDWQVALTTVEDVPDELSYVAVRGHHIKAVDSLSAPNSLQIKFKNLVDAPFENQYIVQNVLGGQEIWWMVPKEGYENIPGGFSEFISLPAQELMLLIG